MNLRATLDALDRLDAAEANLRRRMDELIQTRRRVADPLIERLDFLRRDELLQVAHRFYVHPERRSTDELRRGVRRRLLNGDRA